MKLLRLFSSLASPLRNKHPPSLCKPFIKDLVKYPVIASCTAEEFNLSGIENHFLHLPITTKTTDSISLRFPSNSPPQKECFFFKKGTLIGWNMSQSELDSIVKEIHAFQVKPHEKSLIENEHFDFAFLTSTTPSGESKDYAESITSSAVFPDAGLIGLSVSEESEVSLDKLAFSHGLSDSVKLAVLESQLEAFIASIRHLPDILLAGQRVRLSRRQVLRKVGELLKFRAHLNLHSGLLDVPDVFWEDARLERYYDGMSGSLDVKKRVAVLNKKLDYANDIAELLREHLSEKHSLSLEWCIILLILVEVLFQFRLHLWH